MSRYSTKLRNISEANQRLERRFLNEQQEQKPTAPQIKTYGKVKLIKYGGNYDSTFLNGLHIDNNKFEGSFKPVDKLDLPAGTYKSVGNCKEFIICDKNMNFLGYIADGIGGCVRCPCDHEYEFEILEDGTAKYYNGVGTNYRKLEGPIGNILENIETVINKVSSEGIKVTPEMVSSPAFEGVWSQQTIGGVFNGTNYQWDLTGILQSGPRSDAEGNILAGNFSDLEYFKKEFGMDISDASPKGKSILGFQYKNKKSGFIVYLSNNGLKSFNFNK